MSEPRFIADEMLGSLARWLRIMGYDTMYAQGMDDTEILHVALEQDRRLLTRDRQLAQRAGEAGMLVSSDDAAEQLEDVIRTYRLEFREERSRCTRCNGPLTEVPGSEVGTEVPPRVRESQDTFYRCTVCGQIYWKGTHWERIVGQVGEAMRNAYSR